MLLKLSEVSLRSATVITRWYAETGNEVKMGQVVAEASSDKATFDVEVPCDGSLLRILKKTGEVVLPGEAIAEIQERI
jgi:2-oxoglutarate dehydrogenase E2 component (dihydrolipoamide succinyltransferase)